MIRAGCEADKETAISLYKVSETGTLAAGLVLAGFGTDPIPGAICDDAIQRTMQYAAHHLQRALSALLKQECSNVEYARTCLEEKMAEINLAINDFNRKIGQGTYLAGVISYVTQEHCICLPFGGGYTCLWDNGTIKPIERESRHDIVGGDYNYDALGGTLIFRTPFDRNPYNLGAHLICLTQKPHDIVIHTIASDPDIRKKEVLASAIYRNLPRKDMPIAVLTFTNAFELRSGGGAAL